MDDIDVNDYDSYSLHMLFSLWRLFPKNKQNHASKAIQFIYCRKDDLFLRSNILPERKRDGTLGRCSIYRLYNSSTKNFAAGYQSTRSFVKLGNSSNTTAGAAIFCCCTCFFFVFFGRSRNLEKLSSRLSRSKHKMESRRSFRTETPLVPTKRCSSLNNFYSTWWFRNFRPTCPEKNKNKKT